ncbi:MAG TPA: glycosyl transferase [Sulfuricurvum sp.]|nr:glycosyl transferase [Sulfuricurvum sp.]
MPVYLNYLVNRMLSADHEYRFVGDDAQQEFMQNQMPARIAEAYNKLLDGAAKADMWRAAVLYKLGGTYVDIDAHLVWPLSRLIRPDDSELVIYNRNDYSNFFMAFAPNSVILKETIDMIVENIEENSEGKNVYFLTGPGTLNKALENKSFNYRVFRYVCIQGSFTNEYFQYIDRPGSKWIHKKPSEIMKG